MLREGRRGTGALAVGKQFCSEAPSPHTRNALLFSSQRSERSLQVLKGAVESQGGGQGGGRMGLRMCQASVRVWGAFLFSLGPALQLRALSASEFSSSKQASTLNMFCMRSQFQRVRR